MTIDPRRQGRGLPAAILFVICIPSLAGACSRTALIAGDSWSDIRETDEDRLQEPDDPPGDDPAPEDSTSPPTSWVLTYGGAGYDWGHTAIEAEGIGYMVTGDTRSFGGADTLLILEISPAGEVVSDKSYGSGGSQSVIHPAYGGGYLVAIQNLSVTRLDASRDETWKKGYGGHDDHNISFQATADGGSILAGVSESSGGGSFVSKLDRDGEVQWQGEYGSESWFTCIIQLDDGGYVLGSGIRSIGAGSLDIWLAGLDAGGNVMWERAYGGEEFERVESMTPANEGGFVVSAHTDSFGSGGVDVLLIKMDPGGDIVWQKAYGDPSDNWAGTIQRATGGGYVVAGYKDLSSDAKPTAVLRVDESGNPIWHRTITGATAKHIQQASDGGFILSGETRDFGAGATDIVVMKLDENGNIPADCDVVEVSDTMPAMTDTALTITSTSVTVVSTERGSHDQTFYSPGDLEGVATLHCGP